MSVVVLCTVNSASSSNTPGCTIPRVQASQEKKNQALEESSRTRILHARVLDVVEDCAQLLLKMIKCMYSSHMSM